MSDPKTTEEKIRICISYLQKHGYQVIFPKHGKNSAQVQKLVESQRELMLKMGGASAATLLTAKDVAALIGTTPETLSHYIKKRGLPPPVMGGPQVGRNSELRGRQKGETDRRWRLCDVQAFVQAKTPLKAVP